MIAVCALDCSECNIYKATNDQELAQRIADAVGGKDERYSLVLQQLKGLVST